MKTKIRMYFDAPQLPDGVATILEPAGCGPEVVEVVDGIVLGKRLSSAKLQLDEDDPRRAIVVELLAKHDINVETHSYIEYSDEDRQNARLLWMFRDVNENVSAGLREGTKYDLSEACTNCKTGARQTSALYVDSYYLPKIRKHRAIGCYHGDILVDGGMVKKLKDAGITGISFGEVRARLKNEKWTSVAREQILVAHTMPPMRGELTARDEETLCKVCRRGGRIDLPKQPYREEDLVGMQDFNLTWEWFGGFWPEYKDPEDIRKSRGEKRPSPKNLVTPKVMNIFRDAGVTTFQWTPVAIDG